jgi:drug/metabolite transporter (DMT)-like permease
MLYFVAAIVLNASLGFLFKWMGKYKIPVLDVILINYFICILLGGIFFGRDLIDILNEPPPWIWLTVSLGVLFIGGFLAAATCIQWIGMGPTSILQRISLIITVIYAYFWWGEPLSIWQIIGLVVAIIAIFLVNRQTRAIDMHGKTRWAFLLPVITFLASGIIDSSFYHIKKEYPGQVQDGALATLIFGVALILGLVYKFSLRKKTDQTPLSKKIMLGTMLGLPNFFSIVTLVRAIDSGLPAAVLFPIYNMSIIAIAAIGGMVFFHEKTYFWNVAGLILALISILLISF